MTPQSRVKFENLRKMEIVYGEDDTEEKIVFSQSLLDFDLLIK